ncbi:Chitinase 1, partial [Dissophora globulifera]
HLELLAEIHDYGRQKPLAEYCQHEAEDIIVLAFLHVFNSASRDLPRMDFSNQCNPAAAFQGTSLLHCPDTGAGIKQCQSRGKAILLSLGGAAGAYGFSNDAEAKDFAHMIWNLFLGGSSATRPFDDAVLDGVDLDIEGGSSAGYPVFIQELRSLFATNPQKKYYISAAPQCPFPDSYLGATLQTAWVDMVFVQFYNNYCGTQAYGTFNFNFEQWDTWAKTTAINKDVKIYLGVPASRTAANAGYVSHERLREILDAVRCKYSSFGGVMMWDVSQAYGNLDSGVEYSIAAARDLKRPRHVVCGGPGPIEVEPAPLPAPPPAPAPVPVPVPQQIPAPQQPLPAPVPPVHVEDPPRPPQNGAVSPAAPPPGTHSRCPIEGASCQPPAAGADFGCDFIKGPVKSCSEMEREACAMQTSRRQLREVVDRMWSVFGSAIDSSWADYLGVEKDDMPEQYFQTEDAMDYSSSESQHSFVMPEPLEDKVGETQNDMVSDKDCDQPEPFLIDFVQLEASNEFMSFEVDHSAHTTAPFRTQVRIRTNGKAISPLWQVSFFVKPGQIIKSTTRGKYQQKGLKVTVASDPNAEVEQSMVVRFVVEGVSTLAADGSLPCDMFAASSLPDAALATFFTI